MGGNIVYSRTLPRPSGVISDGDSVTVTGPSATLPNQEFLGGLNGFIDGNTLGEEFMNDARSGWSLLAPSTSKRPTFDNEQTLNRSKAVMFDTRNSTEYKQTLFFDTGASGFVSMYISACIYLTHEDIQTGQYLQWKMIRWYNQADVLDGANGNTMRGYYLSQQIRPAATANDLLFTGFQNAGSVGSPNVIQATKYPTGFPKKGAWYRYETWLVKNSAPGAADGYFRVRCTNVSTGVATGDDSYSDIILNGNADDGNFRYAVLQNYFGNAQDGGFGSSHDNLYACAWWDDIDIVWSSSARSTPPRAELVDNATYASAGVRTSCKVNSISGTSWNISVNKGRHANLTGKYWALFAAGSNTPTMVAA